MNEKVVVSLPEKDNEYQVLQASDARTTGSRVKLDVEVLFAEMSAVLQIQQLFKFVHASEKPTAILVEPVAADGLDRVAQKATASGIAWGILNSTVGYVAELRRQYPALAIFAVGSDQVEIGRIQGRQMCTLLPAGGTVLYIQGPLATSAARERLQGMQEAIAGSKIQPVVLDAQWSEDSAEAAVRQWLRLKTTENVRVDLVAGQDDSMARGARRAVEAAADVQKRWGDVPFLGIDGVPDVGQELVRGGQLTATVVMPSNTGPALEAVASWLKTKVVPNASVRVPVLSFPEEAELARKAASRRR
jgi:ABC-type sugar transport system substrate-binding protein